MAFSLEAALVVPACLIVYVGGLSLAFPSYLRVKDTSVIVAKAVYSSLSDHSLYDSGLIMHDQKYGVRVSSSPKKMIDAFLLLKDIYTPLSGLVDWSEYVE